MIFKNSDQKQSKQVRKLLNLLESGVPYEIAASKSITLWTSALSSYFNFLFPVDNSVFLGFRQIQYKTKSDKLYHTSVQKRSKLLDLKPAIFRTRKFSFLSVILSAFSSINKRIFSTSSWGPYALVQALL